MSHNSSKRQGRPSGARNIKTQAEAEPSRCPHCGSSRRSEYTNSEYDSYEGAGLEFIGIWRRTCSCLDCGQKRRVREKVYPAATEETNAG